MERISILYMVLVTIFIETNSILCSDAETDNSTKSATTTDLNTISNSQPQPGIISAPSRVNTKVDPLPYFTFGQTVRDILSPDIFSEADPVDYLFSKASKLPHEKIRLVSFDLDSLLSSKNKVILPYVPYAGVLLAFVKCLDSLYFLKWYIRDIQIHKPNDHRPISVADISSPDPELSVLFTPDIFADNDAPSAVVRNLLKIPKDKLESVIYKLNNLWYRYPSDSTVQLCGSYIKYLCQFFDENGRYFLKRLRLKVAELQRTISAHRSSPTN